MKMYITFSGHYLFFKYFLGVSGEHQKRSLKGGEEVAPRTAWSTLASQWPFQPHVTLMYGSSQQQNNTCLQRVSWRSHNAKIFVGMQNAF